MNEYNLEQIAKFLSHTYYPKQTGPVTAQQTCKEINERLDDFNKRFNTSLKRPIGEATFRKIVAYIRKERLVKNNLTLLAGSKGYFLSEFKEDTLEQAASLEGRISEMNEVIRALRTSALNQKTKPKQTIVEYNNKPYNGDLFDNLL